MQRDVEALSNREHDLLIVGGGIYGACLALEAATAGYRVALAEKAVFGSGTSFNSLRIIHGGLRYLQHLDFRRMRESIRARREWLRFAPELLQPTDFVMPTFGLGIKGYWALATALRITDVVGWDRNRDLTSEAKVAGGRMLSQSEAKQVLGRFEIEGFNGAACWQDVVCSSSERLLIKVLMEASSHGARLANYSPATRLLVEGDRVVGAEIRDIESGREYTVRAKHVINSAGPWATGLLKSLDDAITQPAVVYSRAFNLIVRNLPVSAAIGIPVPRRGKDQDAIISKGTNTYFLLPWNGLTLIGSKHISEYSSTPGGTVSEEAIETLLAEINGKLTGHQIQRDDVAGVLAGWLPEAGPGNPGQDPVLEKHTRIFDHARLDGVSGLTTVIGVKWTTAREVAREILTGLSLSGQTGGDSDNHQRANDGDRDSGYEKAEGDWSKGSKRLVEDQETTGMDAVRAAKSEMARSLSDFVLRRSDLWLSPFLDRAALAECSKWLSTELDWSEDQQRDQVDDVLETLKTSVDAGQRETSAYEVHP